MLNFDWTTVAVVVAIAFSIFMMGRLSNRHPRVNVLMTDEQLQHLTEAQVRAHNAIRRLNGLKMQYGRWASVQAHKLFLRNQLDYLEEFDITHEDFMKGIDYLMGKIKAYGHRELATF